MKKVLCVFLAILTLSFCFVLNVSAEGLDLADYDYQNFELYKIDLTFMKSYDQTNKQGFIDFINFFGKELLSETIKIPDNINENTIYDLNDNVNYINEIINKNSLRIPYNIIEQIEIYSTTDTDARIKISIDGSQGSEGLYFHLYLKDGNIEYVRSEENNNTKDLSNTYILLPKSKQIWSGSTSCLSYRYIDGEYKFTKPKDMLKGLSYIIDNITYIEPEVMAMRANVTYSLPYVINYVKIVVNSIFTPTGALYTLAPVAIISIAISVLLLGSYIIKRFSWGL